MQESPEAAKGGVNRAVGRAFIWGWWLLSGWRCLVVVMEERKGKERKR